MKLRETAMMVVAAVLPQIASSQGFFLPATDARLRDDLSLLVDEGVMNLPLNEWPLARQDVIEALEAVDIADIHDVALQRTVIRVGAAVAFRKDAATWRIHGLGVRVGEPSLLRDYGTLGREKGEVTSTGGATTDRYGINLNISGVLDAEDGQDIRLDGSDISVRWGNWIFSANQIERWWGPGRDGSLILSTNARPMPAVSLDRVRSVPVNFPVLRWLGPWRFTGFLGVMENHRSDVDRPAFMGMRLSFKPAPIFEFGLSRTAQFCGKGRDCNLPTFGRVLIGRDNPGHRGLDDPEKEPGNQMAGFDVRIVSPFKPLPIAVYGQQIGEDNSSTGIPERYLALFGTEAWFRMRTGSVLRAHLEYSNTKVKWYNSDVEYDVAYTQGIFHEGYRYYGRNVGHTTDGDSEGVSAGLSVTAGDGTTWGVRARRARLDRCCGPGRNSTISFGPSDYKSVELSWKGEVMGQSIGFQAGYENQKPESAGDADGLFGFIEWRTRFDSP